MEAVIVNLSIYAVAFWTATLHLYDERAGRLVYGRALPGKAKTLGFEALRGNVGKVCRGCLRMALCSEMDRLAAI